MLCIFLNPNGQKIDILLGFYACCFAFFTLSISLSISLLN